MRLNSGGGSGGSRRSGSWPKGCPASLCFWNKKPEAWGVARRLGCGRLLPGWPTRTQGTRDQDFPRGLFPGMPEVWCGAAGRTRRGFVSTDTRGLDGGEGANLWGACSGTPEASGAAGRLRPEVWN